MRQRIITGLIFALVVAIFVIPGLRYPVIPLIFMLLVGCVSLRELGQAFSSTSLRPGMPILYISLLLTAGIPFLPINFSASLSVALYVLILLMIMACLQVLLSRGPAALPSAVLTSVLLAYVVFPVISAAVILFKAQQGWMWFVIGLAAPWVSDVFAFFTGSLLGKHPIVPAVSPKKTVEGFIGGLVGGVLIMWLSLRILEPIFSLDPGNRSGHTLLIILGGILLSVASQLGDWLASGIKRWCGIKDFGHLLPGHGGVLDRFDSAFFTLPASVVLFAVYNSFIIG